MRALFWSILGILWLAAGTLGLVGVTAYEATPSAAGDTGLGEPPHPPHAPPRFYVAVVVT